MSNVCNASSIEIVSINSNTPLIIQDGDIRIVRMEISSLPDVRGYFGRGIFEKLTDCFVDRNTFPFVLDYEGRSGGTFLISGHPILNSDRSAMVETVSGEKYKVRNQHV